MGKRRSVEEWNQIRAAYMAGGEIRALARAAGIAEGSALCRARREGWRRQRDQARLVVAPPAAAERISHAIAKESGDRAKRHVHPMESVTDRIGGVVESLDGDTALNRINQLDRYDVLTRRTLGIKDASQSPAVLINVARIMPSLGDQG